MIASTEPKSNTPRADFPRSDQGIRELKRTPGLSRPEKAVLSELHEHAGHDGSSWPSVATICEGTGYSDRTIHKATRALEQRGLLEIQRRKAQSNRYRIRYPAVDRGCGPMEYAKRTASAQQTPTKSAAAPRAPSEADKVAQATETIEGIEKLAAFYRCSTTQVMLAIQRARKARPRHFGAYVRKILQNNQREPTLLSTSREGIMAARAALRALEAKGAAA